MKPLPGPKPYTVIITQFSADFDLHQHHCGVTAKRTGTQGEQGDSDISRMSNSIAML